ncbi:MAG TPA: TlpA disulfide reductase family protein [Candidatus Paceibacterota bacterium]|nr:TlpA disulfide reductase family protein [Candidatus Paceibacterota bacterium]
MKQRKSSFWLAAGKSVEIRFPPTKYAWVLLIVCASMLKVVAEAEAQGDLPSATNSPSSTASVEDDPAEKKAFQQAMETFGPEMDTHDAHKAVHFPGLRAAMEKYWAQFPAGRHAKTLLNFYMDMFAKDHPDRVEAEWGSFTQSSSPVAADIARGKVRFFELRQKPFDLAFVAVDGRLVDLKNLRGKPVLIDFWATWCVPCVKQMPTLKRLYAGYHEKGFEIIGVSLDLSDDKRKLIDFIAKNDLAWPQCFDGKGWQNEFVTRYAVSSAPTTFLLDKEGKLVGIDLERDKLESEIKRLLGIPQPSK